MLRSGSHGFCNCEFQYREYHVRYVRVFLLFARAQIYLREIESRDMTNKDRRTPCNRWEPDLARTLARLVRSYFDSVILHTPNPLAQTGD